MTDAGWARKMVAEVETETGYVWFGAAMDMVEAEHARAIRIVKAEIKYAAHAAQKTKLNRELNAYWQGKLDGAENILAALQRGRGGKG